MFAYLSLVIVDLPKYGEGCRDPLGIICFILLCVVLACVVKEEQSLKPVYSRASVPSCLWGESINLLMRTR